MVVAAVVAVVLAALVVLAAAHTGLVLVAQELLVKGVMVVAVAALVMGHLPLVEEEVQVLLGKRLKAALEAMEEMVLHLQLLAHL